MDLIDVDVIGSKSTQRVFNFSHDASAAGVARYSPTIPLKADLGGDYHARPEPAFGNGSANDLFRATESIDRSCVNNIDTTLEGSLDGSNRFRFVGPTPHPATDGPRTDRDGRHSERRAWNFSAFHFRFESICRTIHDSVLSSSGCVFRLWWAGMPIFSQRLAGERRRALPPPPR